MKLSAKEIANILGVSRVAIVRRAKREKWLFVEEDNPNGGKPIKYFIVEGLPADVRTKVLSNVTADEPSNVTNVTSNVTTYHSDNKALLGMGKNGNGTNGTALLLKNNEINGRTESGSLIKPGLRNFSGVFKELKEPQNGLIKELEDDEIWLEVKEVSQLLGVTDRAVRKNCESGNYKISVVYSQRARAGKVYKIALSSLPASAQVKWVREHQDEAKGLSEPQKERLCPEANWEIALLNAKTERVGLLNLADPNIRDRIARKVKIIQEAMAVPCGYSKTEWVKKVAEKYGVSPKTIYRDMAIYREQGPAGLAKKRNKGILAWSKEALDFLSGVFLKAIKEGGQISKQRAYEAVLEEAKKRKWKVGTYRSACLHLKNLNQLALKYARGGRRALDNLFYIARRYDDLKPFEIVVCDQHRFDFWVKDLETGDIFRPECFACIDMRTRLFYGISIAKHYDKYMVGHALRMGLLRFGLFQKIYTDNGKPEISKYVDTIIRDFATVGSEAGDIADLYKSEDGYVIENEKGEIVDVVPDARQWHIRANVKNAKAKPIEAFFRGFEPLLRDLGVPGLVRELKALSEEKDEDTKRIKRLIDKDKLLSFEEFVAKVFEAIEKYNNRKHRSLGHSPMEELEKCVREEGFIATKLPEEEVDFILLARAKRSVSRGRIIINGELYEGKEVKKENPNAGLWHIPDKTKVEVRYDPFDPDKVFAILPKGGIRKLHRVVKGSMKDRELTQQLLERKRRMINASIALYRQLTTPVPSLIKHSKTVSLQLRRLKKESVVKRQEMDEEEIMRKADEMVRKSQEEKMLPFARKKRIFKSKRDRYQFCLEQVMLGNRLSYEDAEFMQAYEETMDKGEREYWDAYKEFLEKEVSNQGRR